ncbi:cell filamentation protein Fic [Actinomyces graevenitzii]|uniref:Fic family protein n=1 Tax=Actinomyces graevenitzii TaxID=55565 RepID=UPI000C80D618|nr:Fic family protein [Actinomyces graevenitzii]PMC91421.1 cell filamentation protein Fic [Actinomyces graevenitzii]
MSTNALIDACLALAREERVAAASEALYEASAQLRWQEALRKRWREARAEASVRGAVSGAAIEGAVVSAQALREQIAAGPKGAGAHASSKDPAWDAATGLWRAHSRLVGYMPDLVGRTRPVVPATAQLMATLHRDVAGPLAVGGLISEAVVGCPRESEQALENQSLEGGGLLEGGKAALEGAGLRENGKPLLENGKPLLEGGPGPNLGGQELRERLEQIVALIDTPNLPALVRVALVHAEMLTVRPFALANGALGRLLVRHLSVRDGLDPTGVSVSDYYAGRVPGAYAEAAQAYASASLEGVVAWIIWQAEALLEGMRQGSELSRAVQAGSTRDFELAR